MDSNFPTTPPTPPVQPVSVTAIPRTPPITGPVQPAPQVPPIPYKSKFPIFIITALLIIILGVGGFVACQKFFFKETPPEATPTVTVAPSPTIDPTADWKTYTNSRLNFQFEYPNNVNVNKLSTCGECSPQEYQNEVKKYELITIDDIETETGSDSTFGIKIAVYIDTDLNLKKFAQDNYKENITNKYSFIKIVEELHNSSFLKYPSFEYSLKGRGLNTAITGSYSARENTYNAIFFEKDKDIYAIFYSNSYPFNQILSTFRFTE